METGAVRIAQILGKMNGGGAEQVVMNYYRAIDRKRAQFDIFCFKSSRMVPAEEIKRLGGGLYLLCGFSRPVRYVRTLSRLLKENGYTIVHCHLSTLSFLPLLAAKMAGIPVRILHNHSTSGGRREIIRNAAKALLKPLARLFATDLFACSELSARWMYKKLPTAELCDNNAPDNAVRIMKNAVDTALFRYDEQKRLSLRKELDIPKNAPVILHVGRFCPQKNQQFLVDIFSEVADKKARLIMVGTGGDMELIKARVMAAGLSGRVIFAGQRADIDRFYSAADCFVLPSNYEGLPLCGVEAQCAGLYCVFSDKVTKEVKLTDGAQFLSLKTPPRDWAFAVTACARLKNTLGAEQTANAGYDIHEQAGELLNYYLRRINETRDTF